MDLKSVTYLLLNVVTICFQYALGESYNVAVMEFAMNMNFSQPSQAILDENTRNYLNLIEDVTQNRSEAIDLIIFPESTLTQSPFSSDASQLPNVTDIVLCNSTDDIYSSYLKNLSCAAIRHNTTIVINFTEKEICENGHANCPDSGEIFYNTNIAFGNNGTIIARYRKWNLFGEYGKNKPTKLDLPIIRIKNATFGMMTCFDIQFGIPGFNLTRDKGVRNIIFPLHWISELPYLTALQVEQMWAQEFNVVLLASGASIPTRGGGGSGIFFGNQGPLDSDILPEIGTKVMVHSVPTDTQQTPNVSYTDDTVETIDAMAASMDNFYMLVDPSIKDHNSLVLNTTAPTTNTTVCSGEGNNILCCEFDISVSTSDVAKDETSYTYQLVVFNGVRTYSGLYYGGVESCGVVACLNSSVVSCGQRFQNYSNIVWPLEFNYISVKGNFSRSEQRVQYPTTLLSSIRPLRVQEYLWEKEHVGSAVLRRIILQKSQTRLLTFGIFGRDFERDWDPIRNNNFATKLSFSWLTSFCLLICTARFVVRILSKY